MLAYITRYLGRRRLSPAVGVVPMFIKRAFGNQDHYSAGQVGRAVRELKLKKKVAQYAYAACCDEIEFAKVKDPGNSYQHLRHDLCKLFDLKPDFTCMDLLALRNVPRYGTSANFYDSSYGQSGGGPD